MLTGLLLVILGIAGVFFLLLFLVKYGSSYMGEEGISHCECLKIAEQLNQKEKDEEA